MTHDKIGQMAEAFVEEHEHELHKLMVAVWNDGYQTAMRECRESMKDVEGIVVSKQV